MGTVKAPRLDLDLSDSVLEDIRERRLSPFRRKPRPLTPSFPAWVGVAVAACVLCAVGLGSYLGFAAYLGHGSKPANDSMVKQDDPTPERERSAPVPEEKREPKREPKKEIAHNATPRGPYEFVGPQPGPRDENPTPIVKVTVPKPNDPTPPGMNPVKDGSTDKPLTDRATGPFKLEMVTGTPRPLVLKLHDLDKAEPRLKLNEELGKSGGFRVELPCDNGTKAFERLQAACKEQKVSLLIDRTAQQRLKKPQSKTDYYVYLENVTAEALSQLLGQIAAEDRNAGSKKPSEARFDWAVVMRMTKRDYGELSELLGVDPSRIESTGPLGTDLRRPFSEQTAEQIGKALEGNKARPTDGGRRS